MFINPEQIFFGMSYMGSIIIRYNTSNSDTKYQPATSIELKGKIYQLSSNLN